MLIAGFLLAPLPPRLLQPAFDAMLRVVKTRHPGILERLADWSDKVVVIDPVDLPFALVLRPDAQAPSLTATARAELPPADAVIHAPLDSLLALAEGRLDGDAMFFSRDLVIEGDTELVLALRNGVDGAGIDLVEDLAGALGPFQGAARLGLSAIRRLHGRLSLDLARLGAAIAGPALRAADINSKRLAQLEQDMTALRKAARARGR